MGFLVLGATATMATQPQNPPREARYEAYIAKNAVHGPASIPLRDQAVLSLPVGMAFLSETPAKEFMARIGNDTDSGFMGLVIPGHLDSDGSGWFSLVEYTSSGYIRDDDAKNWNADEILASVRQNTEEANSERRLRHQPELEVLGWVEKPHYDKATHKLIWSISARDKGQAGNARRIINYRTLALGRDGYIAMIMVTDLDKIDAEKPLAARLISGVKFNSAKRYGDFNSSTDHVAEYGLAALIGGVVVHKLGFFALLAAFAAKSIKVIGLTALAGLAWVRRLFGRKTAPPAAAVTQETSEPK